ncbi:WSC domain-containing protein 2, partial [Eremomyces bilateralis CBS 781.70]
MSLGVHITALPTWPAAIDEFEEIMYQLVGYKKRGFAEEVTPCGFSREGLDRMASSEWIRTAFHDMATANVFGTSPTPGGIDASIMFELDPRGENTGKAFNTSLTTYNNFFTSRVSMADLIALGVFAAVRSCGGPAIPMKTGRIDASVAGSIGVPQPGNSPLTFQGQFQRMGFNQSEMIEMVACGHTVGGVHGSNFPDVVPPGSAPFDFQRFDNTDVFDSKIASDFVSGTTVDPLVVGLSAGQRVLKNSDTKVFTIDNNVTITRLANPAQFESSCKRILGRMVDTVPPTVTLSAPVEPYEVKPIKPQLTLQDGGVSILFSGEIRVRTTNNTVAVVQISYNDRTGGSAGTISTKYVGTGRGFDDTFDFFSFSKNLSSTGSISSYTVDVTYTSGLTVTYDNNGSGYPIRDTIMLQTPQSCIVGGTLTAVAAVRGISGAPILALSLKNPLSVAGGYTFSSLGTESVPMTAGSTIGPYILYTASYALTGDQAPNTKFEVATGSSTDSFKDTSTLPTTCKPLGASPPSDTPTPGYTYQGCFTDDAGSRAFNSGYIAGADTIVEGCAAFCSNFQFFGIEYGAECYCGNTRAASSLLAAASECNMPCGGDPSEICGGSNRLSVYKNEEYAPMINPDVAGYSYEGCWTDSPTRYLSGSATAGDSMTVPSCAGFCDGSNYFGVEYSRECYCGSTLSAESVKQPETDCNIACAGNGTTWCGAGNRFNLYKK